MGKFPYTHNLGLGLRAEEEKTQFRTQIKIIESKCSTTVAALHG